MRFSVGDSVHLPGIGTGVVREIRRGDRYVVVVKNTAMVVTAAQLEPAVAPRRNASRETVPHASPDDGRRRGGAPTSIDLHGRTALEAAAAVDEFLNEALLAGLATVSIIHGRSGGRVKQAVHARLRQLPSIRAFRLDPANPGVTIVEL